MLLYAVFFSVGDSIADERVRRRRTEIVLMFWQAGLELALVTGGVCALSAHEKNTKAVAKSPFVSQKNANFATVQDVEPLKK